MTDMKYRDVVYKLECLLCYATGNRYSKSEYSLQDMERMVDDYVQQLIDEATENTVSRDEYERVCRERDAAVADLKTFHWCGFCKYCDLSGGKEPCCSCDCGKEWEWRGIDETN